MRYYSRVVIVILSVWQQLRQKPEKQTRDNYRFLRRNHCRFIVRKFNYKNLNNNYFFYNTRCTARLLCLTSCRHSEQSTIHSSNNLNVTQWQWKATKKYLALHVIETCEKCVNPERRILLYRTCSRAYKYNIFEWIVERVWWKKANFLFLLASDF